MGWLKTFAIMQRRSKRSHTRELRNISILTTFRNRHNLSWDGFGFEPFQVLILPFLMHQYLLRRASCLVKKKAKKLLLNQLLTSRVSV